MRSPHVPTRAELEDERVLIGVTAGIEWTLGAVVVAVAGLLPGASVEHRTVLVALAAAVFVYGVVSVLVVPWEKLSVAGHARMSASLMPIFGVALWLTGGAISYMHPLTIFVIVHVAFFFPRRWTLALGALFLTVMATPFAYQPEMASQYASRYLTATVGTIVLGGVLGLLRDRLVRAEDRQRRMAMADSLTGLANRRAFDAALADAAAAGDASEHGRRAADAAADFAVILLDLDGFKGINDTHGHPAGDRLLREVASRCAHVVRPQDTLARIGGDEFAVVAPGAGELGARRLADALRVAVAATGVRTTVAWAVWPIDGQSADELLQEADRRLYAGKHRFAGAS